MKLHKLIKLLLFLSKLKKKLNFLKFKIKIGIYDTCYMLSMFIFLYFLFLFFYYYFKIFIIFKFNRFRFYNFIFISLNSCKDFFNNIFLIVSLDILRTDRLSI